MLPGRCLARWTLYFRGRRRLLRLLLSCAAASCLLLLASIQQPDQRGSSAAASSWPRKLDAGSCSRVKRNRADLQLADVFPSLNFTASWTKKKTFWNDDMEKRFQHIKKKPPFPLKIMVVPHSHNDPGWGGTIVQYYRTRTSHILNMIVHMMPKLPQMRFMWTEVSFLQLWWADATPSQKKTFRELVDSGRLEITTGGWVMTDEAVTRLYPMLDQLTEGHWWLRHHLNVTVKTGWSVDPFGHSSTMPYILKQANIDQAVIMRTPYVWKEYLAAHQAGDFMWQQQWDREGSTSLLTHHHPYFMYTTSAACGPFGESTKMCFNFDFARDWSQPVPWYYKFTHVTDANIKDRAEMLVEQAGRTASLFPHNVALMMLGADFQFKYDFEWREQYTNYTKLMAYINDHPELGAQIQFATPAEYFSTVRQRSRGQHQLPTLVGDFHVYSDVFQAKPKYWSGYYTTLPHWKRAARQLEALLRATDILFAFAWSQHRDNSKGWTSTLPTFHHSYKRIVLSRQDVGLFNHHDAITGTSSTAVMADYVERLSISEMDLSRACIMSIASLTLELHVHSKVTELFNQYSPLQRGLGVIPELLTFDLEEGTRRRLVLYNPLAQQRTDVVQFLVHKLGVMVTDNDEREVTVQLEPHGSAFKVSALVRLPPLSVSVFHVWPMPFPQKTLAKPIYSDGLEDTFSIRNDRFTVTFNKTGLTWSINDTRLGRAMPFRTSFGRYKTIPGESGLYLFNVLDEFPEALPCQVARWELHSGKALSEAVMTCKGYVRLTVRLYHTSSPIGQAVHLQTDVLLSRDDNERDVFLHIHTGVKSCSLPPGCGFYTDSNDYQMLWRPLAESAGVPANIYPVTTQASLQDTEMRVSLLMDHSHGVGSLQEGSFTVILDRRSQHDDDRGIGQGNQANKPVQASFAVVFDHLPTPPIQNELFASSPLAALLARQLNHPVRAYMDKLADSPRVKSFMLMLDGALPCDWEIVTLRQASRSNAYMYPSGKMQLTLLRRRLDCSLWDERDGLTCRPGATSQAEFSRWITIDEFTATTVTGGRRSGQGSRLSGLRDVRMRPDQLRSFEISYRRPELKHEVTTSAGEIELVHKLNDVKVE